MHVYWNDTKRLMVPPEGQVVLAEHLKYGMFYEVFSYDCVLEDKAAMRSLCQADNFDSAFADMVFCDGGLYASGFSDSDDELGASLSAPSST